MTFLSRLRLSTALLSTALLSTALVGVAADAAAQQGASLPELTPSQIALDVRTVFIDGQGVRAAPDFDPFESIEEFAGRASLRQAIAPIDRETAQPILGDGAVLDVAAIYTGGSADAFDLRGFERAVFLNGEPVQSVRYDSETLDCSTRVTDVVYRDDYYDGLSHGLLAGLTVAFPRYRGHRYFGYDYAPFGSFGYVRGYRARSGFGHGGYGRRGYGSRSYYRHGARGVYRDGYRDGVRDERRYDRRRDRRAEDRREDRRRDRRAEDRRDRRTIVGQPPAPVRTVPNSRALDRYNRDEGRRRAVPRARTVDGQRVRPSTRASSRDGWEQRERQPRLSNGRPQESSPNRRRSNQPRVGEPRVSRPRIEAPVPRDRKRTRMENRPIKTYEPQRAQRSEPRRSETARSQPQRSAPPRSAPKRSVPKRDRARSVDRAVDRTFKRNQRAGSRGLEYYPAGTRVVDQRCAKEERLALFIPAERLDAARFDGLTVVMLGRDGTELPVFIPPNYVDGFRQGVGSSGSFSSGSPVIYQDPGPL